MELCPKNNLVPSDGELTTYDFVKILDVIKESVKNAPDQLRMINDIKEYEKSYNQSDAGQVINQIKLAEVVEIDLDYSSVEAFLTKLDDIKSRYLRVTNTI